MAIANVLANQGNAESETEDSEQEEESITKKKGGKKNKKKELGGIPRKQFKKLIKKELDKQCKNIFNNMMSCQELGGEAEE